jgi:hypothetical protein
MTYKTEIDLARCQARATELAQENQDQSRARGRWLDRPLAPSQGEHRCPCCQSIIYSRRHKLCGVCNRPLPAELLFSETEARRIAALLRREKQRHRQWLATAFA